VTHEAIQGYTEAYKALEANLSPRARHLTELERYVDGTQYAGLPDWFSDEKPLWERAPCIVYPAVANAISSNKDLLLGDGRFPTFDVESLEGEQAEKLERAISRVVKQSRFRAAAREVFGSGQGCGSAVGIFGLRGGRLFVDTTRAKWCEAELDVEGAVVSLEIKYPYIAVEKAGGVTKAVARIYRRVLDATSDTTFMPAEARLDGVEPKEWIVDAKKTVRHGLGYCPVVWYPHMRTCAIVGDIDGQAIHENLTDEVRAHDFSLSQRHRAALYTGDPQWTEVGVAPGYSPTNVGRRPEVPASLTGKVGEASHASYVSGHRRGKARRKGPGVVWQYEAKDVQVKLHTLPADALKAVSDHAADLRVKLAESLGVVFLDPETMPTLTNLSGRTLEALKARQLDRCDNYRSDFGDRFILPAVGMLLRIARDKKLAIDGLEVLDAVIAKAGEQWSWHSPPVELSWPRYFRLDADEEAKTVDLVNKAHDGGLLTVRKGVEKLRGVFDVKDVDAYLAELEAEKAERMKAQQKLAADMMLTADSGDESGDEGENDDGEDADEPGTPARRGGGGFARKA
jgi:hypothetical protein